MATAGVHLRHVPSRDLLRLHVLRPERYPFFLESSGGGSVLARYDILFAFPGASLTLEAGGTLRGSALGGRRSFLEALDAAWASAHRDHQPALEAGLPFRGGWFVFLAYELANQIEPSLSLPVDPEVPVASATRVPAAIIRRRDTGAAVAVTEPGAADLLDLISADCALAAASAPATGGGRLLAGPLREEDPAAFLGAVSKVKAHITAGDIYQANISRRWVAEVDRATQPWMLYERLRLANPAPFGGLAIFDEAMAIVSSSPERLVQVAGGRIATRPIAGTRPRARPGGDDDLMRRELLASAKEKAEHVMLIDLERNDLGRICAPGTVRVDDFMTIESYAHVHHIVSAVSGELREGVRPGQILRAVFPGGTITGCPKVRCMGIIGEVERQPRGVYTGAMGYVNHDGSCDFSILIRSLALSGRTVSFGAGSGIVADSDPLRELDETRAKARGMALALQG